jgi:hypothetical protein
VAALPAVLLAERAFDLDDDDEPVVFFDDGLAPACPAVGVFVDWAAAAFFERFGLDEAFPSVVVLFDDDVVAAGFDAAAGFFALLALPFVVVFLREVVRDDVAAAAFLRVVAFFLVVAFFEAAFFEDDAAPRDLVAAFFLVVVFLRVVADFFLEAALREPERAAAAFFLVVEPLPAERDADDAPRRAALAEAVFFFTRDVLRVLRFLLDDDALVDADDEREDERLATVDSALLPKRGHNQREDTP